jgi:hypothetical protein
VVLAQTSDISCCHSGVWVMGTMGESCPAADECSFWVQRQRASVWKTKGICSFRAYLLLLGVARANAEVGVSPGAFPLPLRLLWFGGSINLPSCHRIACSVRLPNMRCSNLDRSQVYEDCRRRRRRRKVSCGATRSPYTNRGVD